MTFKIFITTTPGTRGWRLNHPFVIACGIALNWKWLWFIGLNPPESSHLIHSSTIENFNHRSCELHVAGSKVIKVEISVGRHRKSTADLLRLVDSRLLLSSDNFESDSIARALVIILNSWFDTPSIGESFRFYWLWLCHGAHDEVGNIYDDSRKHSGAWWYGGLPGLRTCFNNTEFVKIFAGLSGGVFISPDASRSHWQCVECFLGKLSDFKVDIEWIQLHVVYVTCGDPRHGSTLPFNKNSISSYYWYCLQIANRN